MEVQDKASNTEIAIRIFFSIYSFTSWVMIAFIFLKLYMIEMYSFLIGYIFENENSEQLYINLNIFENSKHLSADFVFGTCIFALFCLVIVYLFFEFYKIYRKLIFKIFLENFLKIMIKNHN